jgi:hypothetical protein
MSGKLILRVPLNMQSRFEKKISKIGEPALLSVIVPVGEMNGRLNNLISWLVEIRNHPIEVILICDLNGNNSWIELSLLVTELNNSRVTLASGTFGSPGETRNAGFKYCTSPWVAFWDSDDIPEWRKVIETISSVESKIDIVIGGFQIKRDSGAVTIGTHLPDVDNALSNLYSVARNPGLWRMVIRRSIVSGIYFSKEKMAEDHIYILSLSLPEKRIFFTKDLFYNYFLGDSGHLTSNKQAMRDLRRVITIVRNEFANSRKTQSRYVGIFLSREFISLVRHGRTADRLFAISLLLTLPTKVGIVKAILIYIEIFKMVTSK